MDRLSGLSYSKQCHCIFYRACDILRLAGHCSVCVTLRSSVFIYLFFGTPSHLRTSEAFPSGGHIDLVFFPRAMRSGLGTQLCASLGNSFSYL